MSDQTSENHSFEGEWRARFDRFAARGGSEARISGWSEHGLQRRLQAIARALRDFSPVPAARVVDLGCGTGVYCNEIRGQGYAAVGADFSTGMLKRAKDVAPEAQLCAADLNHLPFRDVSFQALINVGVLQHLSSVDRALSEMARILAPQAPAFIITLNRWSGHSLAAWLRDHIKALLLRGRWQVKQHAVRRSVGAMVEQAQRAGFELEAVRGLYLFPKALGFVEKILDLSDGWRLPGSKKPLFLPLANAYLLVLRRR